MKEKLALLLETERKLIETKKPCESHVKAM